MNFLIHPNSRAHEFFYWLGFVCCGPQVLSLAATDAVYDVDRFHAMAGRRDRRLEL
jgi:hypothetical protein